VQRFCKPKVGSSILSTGTTPFHLWVEAFSDNRHLRGVLLSHTGRTHGFVDG
jgi:hypothetical protein